MGAPAASPGRIQRTMNPTEFIARHVSTLPRSGIRDFFELVLLGPGQWFLVLLSVAIGLTIASVLWKLPQIEKLEVPEERVDAEA